MKLKYKKCENYTKAHHNQIKLIKHNDKKYLAATRVRKVKLHTNKI